MSIIKLNENISVKHMQYTINDKMWEHEKEQWIHMVCKICLVFISTDLLHEMYYMYVIKPLTCLTNIFSLHIQITSVCNFSFTYIMCISSDNSVTRWLYLRYRKCDIVQGRICVLVCFHYQQILYLLGLYLTLHFQSI